MVCSRSLTLICLMSEMAIMGENLPKLQKLHKNRGLKAGRVIPEGGACQTRPPYVRSMWMFRPFSCGTLGSGGIVLMSSGTNVFGSSCANRIR